MAEFYENKFAVVTSEPDGRVMHGVMTVFDYEATTFCQNVKRNGGLYDSSIRSDLLGHEGATSPRGLVVEEDPVALTTERAGDGTGGGGAAIWP